MKLRIDRQQALKGLLFTALAANLSAVPFSGVTRLFANGSSNEVASRDFKSTDMASKEVVAPAAASDSASASAAAPTTANVAPQNAAHANPDDKPVGAKPVANVVITVRAQETVSAETGAITPAAIPVAVVKTASDVAQTPPLVAGAVAAAKLPQSTTDIITVACGKRFSLTTSEVRLQDGTLGIQATVHSLSLETQDDVGFKGYTEPLALPYDKINNDTKVRTSYLSQVQEDTEKLACPKREEAKEVVASKDDEGVKSKKKSKIAKDDKCASGDLDKRMSCLETAMDSFKCEVGDSEKASESACTTKWQALTDKVIKISKSLINKDRAEDAEELLNAANEKTSDLADDDGMNASKMKKIEKETAALAKLANIEPSFKEKDDASSKLADDIQADALICQQDHDCAAYNRDRQQAGILANNIRSLTNSPTVRGLKIAAQTGVIPQAIWSDWMSPYVDTLQNFSVISNPLGTITSGIGGTAGLNGTTRVLNPAGPFAANGGMQVGLPTQSFFGGVSANNGLSPAGPFAGSNYGLSTNLLNSTPSVAATPFLRTANVAGAPAARTSALSFN